ncbi:MAG TPA: hypothetical protein DCE42_17625 [Myxococcales bacterium]|nr:hypothetical protein [Deltaproteobacteria bacterium]MBU48403.1 hypothetical protein [Deltaproteobacteria bacterium]HAA56588.1 hypothetical protein [Myxococcales bacterium]
MPPIHITKRREFSPTFLHFPKKIKILFFGVYKYSVYPELGNRKSMMSAVPFFHPTASHQEECIMNVKAHLSSMMRVLCLGFLLFFACGDPGSNNNNNNNNNAECTKDEECKTDERCGTKGKCFPILCGADSDCRDQWHCNFATERCQAAPYDGCKENTDCELNEICESNRCVAKAECTTDTDCTDAQKPKCESGKCVAGPECTKNEDCTDTQKPVCKDNKCIEKEKECDQDTDCKDPTKPSCKDGQCVEPQPECAKSSDCTDPAKPICSGRKCIADSGVGEGLPCEPGVTECKSAFFCYKEDSASTKGVCRIECLAFSPQCPANKVCRQTSGSRGICLDENNGKKEGESCETDACENNLFCASWKGKKICATPCDPSNAACATGEECYEAITGRFLCVAERDPCGIGRPCPDGEDCLSSRCTPKPPCNPACASDELCDSGTCRKKQCPSEIQCATGENCVNGTCVNPTSNPPCKPCQSGQCPNTGAQCLSGYGNDTNSYCYESCAGGKACPDPAHFSCKMININLNNTTCTSDTDCTAHGSNVTCSNGKCTRNNVALCLPTIGTCTNKCGGVTCPTGTTCIPATGTCGGKKLCDTCKVNEECGGTNDLCLRANGGTTSFCGLDCTNDASVCPTGFNCFTINGQNVKNCAPANLTCPAP